MSTLDYTTNMIIRQDPDDRLDHNLLLTSWLAVNPDTPQVDPDTIVGHEFLTSATGDDAAVIEFINYGENDDSVYFFLSNVVVNQTITIRITTAFGRIKDFSFRLKSVNM